MKISYNGQPLNIEVSNKGPEARVDKYGNVYAVVVENPRPTNKAELKKALNSCRF